MRPSDISIILEQEFFSVEHGHHTPVMLWGPPGVGKSQLVAQLGNKHEVPVIDIRLSQIEPSDLRGIPFREDDQVIWAIPSMLPNERSHSERGILFLDEITSAAPSVSAAAYQLILDRKLGEYELPKDWVIFAAGNRQGDRGISYTMPSPLANRFSHYEVETHLDDWVKWAYYNDIDERIIAFVRFRPDLLFDFDPAKNPTAFPTPRTWEYASRALKKYTNNSRLLLGALQACVGESAGVECFAFVENFSSIPDIDAIVSGENVPVPSQIDLLYAVAAALVGRAIKVKNSDQANIVHSNILNYAANFPQREMGVMLVSDMHRAIGQSIFALEAFEQWADTVADLMLYD